MGTSALNLMRLARLYNPSAGQLPPLPQVQDQGLPPISNPQGTGNPHELPFTLQDAMQVQTPNLPQELTPRGQALSSYRQAMQQQSPQAPKQADYQPSILRRILGGAAGVATALGGNPQAGAQLDQQIISGPYSKAMGAYNEQMSDYQKKLAQKKEAYETEAGAEAQEAKIGEVKSQKEAEVARAGAEEARRQGELFKVSPPGLKQAQDLARIKHPDALPVNQEIELTNGKTVIAHEGKNGQYEDSAGNIYGPDAIKHVYKVATEPRESADKNRNEYNDFARGMKKDHPEMGDAEIAEAWKDKEAQIGAKYEKAPQTIMIDPSGMAQRVTPGSQVAPGSVSPSGESSQNVDTAPTRQMQETAPKVIDLVDRTTQLIDQQVKALGPLSSRWSEFMAGKVGAPNPEFTRLRTNAALLQTLLLRMHIGSRGGQQIMAHFKDLMDTGKQSPENLKAALEEIKAYAQDIGKSSKRGGDLGAKTEEPKTSPEVANPKDPLGILK